MEKRLNALKKVIPPEVTIKNGYDMTAFIRDAIGSVHGVVFQNKRGDGVEANERVVVVVAVVIGTLQ